MSVADPRAATKLSEIRHLSTPVLLVLPIPSTVLQAQPSDLVRAAVLRSSLNLSGCNGVRSPALTGFRGGVSPQGPGSRAPASFAGAGGVTKRAATSEATARAPASEGCA